MISILHPSRGRSNKSIQTIYNWLNNSSLAVEVIVSLDVDDHLPMYYAAYNDSEYAKKLIVKPIFCLGNHKSSVEAINHAATRASGEILIVVSDDTDCFPGWDTALFKIIDGQYDFILKTHDGIQDYIITLPILDRAYYNRFGYIYNPGYRHLFCDTHMTCVADINGRKLTSDLMFRHNHYSNSGGKEGPDELHKRNDATWAQGEDLFIKLMKEFTPDQLSRITNVSMRNWLKMKRVL